MFVNSTTKHMLNTVHSVVVRLFCLLAAWCPVLSPSVRPPTFWRVFRSRAEKPCAGASSAAPYPWVLWMGAWGRDCFSEWEKSGAKPHIIMFAHMYFGLYWFLFIRLLIMNALNHLHGIFNAVRYIVSFYQIAHSEQFKCESSESFAFFSHYGLCM